MATFVRNLKAVRNVVQLSRLPRSKVPPIAGIGSNLKYSTDTQIDVTISDSCVKQILRVADEKEYLRVHVEGGGCSGFQYKFDLDKKITEEDKVYEKSGARIVVDKDSLEFLKGATIDYNEDLIRSSFRIIDNPQSEQGCSCGASFALKM